MRDHLSAKAVLAEQGALADGAVLRSGVMKRTCSGLSVRQ